MVRKNTEFVEEFLVKPVFDEDGVQASSGIGRDGKEYPDPVPTAPPIGYEQPMDLMTMIRTMIKSEELRRAAEEQGFETFDEADDFEVDDDPPDPLTDYERVFEPPASPPAAVAPTAPPVPSAATATGAAEAGVASPPPGSVAVQPQSPASTSST